MLEKLAEMVREDALEYDDMNDLTLRCLECDFKPILGKNCRNMQGKDCPLLFNREEKEDFVDGSLMLARWAVLLVARALEKEIERLSLFRGLPPSEAAMEAAAKLGASIYNLITEAKEGRE